MRTNEEHKIGFEGKPIYRYKSQFSSTTIEGNYIKNENHQFVVPWQLAKSKEKEFVMK